MVVNFGFSQGTAKRVVDNTRRGERSAPSTVGGQTPPAQQPEPGFWAAITSQTFDTGTSTYRFAWTEQVPTLAGFSDKSGGNSGTTADDGGYALNTAGYPIVGVLPVVWMRYGWVSDAGTIKAVYRFAYGENPVAMVRIASAGDAGGEYNANILSAPGSDVPAGSDLAASDIGTVGAAVIALNVKEEGSSAHDLTDDGTNTDLDCIGVYLRTNSDGTMVFAIDKLWIGCEASADTDGGTL